MASQSDAQWSDEDAATFLRYGPAFVPRRAEQFRVVTTVVAMAAPRLVVDLCCGEGHLSRALLDELPDVTVEGLDASEATRRAAQVALHSYEDRFRTARFDVHQRPWRDHLKPADAFVSSLALHHLTADEKAAAYGDLRATLTPGGIFVNADLVMAANPAGRVLAAEAWDRSVRDAAGGEAFAAFESLRWNLFRYPDDNDTDYPLPVAQELALMSAAGFVDVDVYWLYAGHAIWGGRAP